MIRLKKTGRLIGIVNFFDEKDGSCEIGYGIGSRFWNQGFATEAVHRFLEYLFREKAKKEKQEGAGNNEDPGLERKS